MSTETTKKKIKIDNGTEFAKVYTDKQTDSKLTAKQDVLTAGTNITIKDNVISASGGSIAATALTNEDLDTLKTEGSYYAGGSNTCTNKPSGIDAFGLTIKRVASGYYTQYLTGGNTNTGQVYTRTFTSGAWTSWVKFTQDTQLATKQDRLVSGTNIKTINGNSLLGSGDLTIEGGTAEIILSDSQMVEININKITFTEAQFNIIKQASYIKFMYNDNEVISGVVNFFSTAEIYTISCFFISLDGLRATLMSIPTNYDYSQLDISIVSIVYDIKLNMGGDNSFYVWFNEEQANYPIYFDTINGKSILHTDSTINEYTIPDTKTISLFGNHSILVPKDSTDTNIDLYNHAIEISGTTSGNYDYSIWFNVVSSKNLVVDSLTDLKTLLGNTFKREVFGFSNTSTTPTAIIGIDETQMYNTNGETTSFANLSSITFTDTVTTI